MTFYDCHAHVFNDAYVPNGLLGVYMSTSDKFLHFVSKIFSGIIPGTNDKLDNIASFLNQATRTPEQNLLDLLSLYPEDSCVCALMIDFKNINGKAEKDYNQQLEDMFNLKKKYPTKLKLFFHFEPETCAYFPATLFPLVDGIKLYPPLGSLPTDYRFKEVFEYCEKKQIPIISHCSYLGVAKSSIWNIFAGNKAHPKHWWSVLDKYPDLKVDLAHFGQGDDKWMNEIVNLMYTYPNVYADVSFSLAFPSFVDKLKTYIDGSPLLADRLLFGSDFYMQDLIEKDLLASINKLRITIGNKMFGKITGENAERFLKHL